MAYETYRSLATAVRTGIDELDYDQQLEILSIVINAMNQKKRPKCAITQEETLQLFNELSGCIKDIKEIDSRKEYLEYLDERYGES